jgi:hypothetical protein
LAKADEENPLCRQMSCRLKEDLFTLFGGELAIALRLEEQTTELLIKFFQERCGKVLLTETDDHT